MKSVCFFFAILFLSSWGFSATLQSAYFDVKTQSLHLEVEFQGSSSQHQFDLQFDDCQVVRGQKQVAARLVDYDGDDTGLSFQSAQLQFDLSALSCKPALLFLRSGKFSQLSLWIDDNKRSRR